MKVLYLEWNSFANLHVKRAIAGYGHEIIEYEYPASEPQKNNEELAVKLVNAIVGNKVDYCFSLNYFPVVAIACKACGIKYVSWTYDSPYVLLYTDTIHFTTNYAFVFDKAEVLNLRKLGVNTVYYMPMGAAIYDKLQDNNSDFKLKYEADIAMVGSMYSEKKHRLLDKFGEASEYTKGYIESLIRAQQYLYGFDIIEPALSERVIEDMKSMAPMLFPDDEFKTAAWIYSKYFMLREVTRRERYECIDALAVDNQVALYTYEATSFGANVDNRGTVDYYKEMPLAMRYADINLNISLRSIVSGIPLRAWDIMGCRGFLISNFQSDFLDFFEPDEECVLFESKTDLIEKTKYYLSNNKRREEIATAAYEKVKAFHTYANRISDIMRIVFEQ